MKLEKFDYQIGNKKKKNTFIILGLVCLGAFITVILYRTFASYKVTNSYNIIGGKVAQFGINGVDMYIVNEDGSESATSILPIGDEYVYDADRSGCNNGSEISYDKSNNTIIFDEATGDTCNVYFKYIPLAKQTLYALGYTDSDIKTGIPYGPDGTNVTGFYAAEDDYGTSYYFYSDGNDAPPSFAVNDQVFYLIRINGDGSTRMYNLDSTMDGFFNSESNDNAYLGYMFGDLNSSLIENNYSSIVKSNLEEGYSSFDQTYLADAIFCNDRSMYKEEYGAKEEDDAATGIGTDTTYYGAYYRLRNNTPSLKCNQKSDAFTVNDTVYGNGMLDYPIGLITADEAYMINLTWPVGAFGNRFTTMSPAMFKDGVANIYYGDWVMEAESVSAWWTYNQVINVKYGVNFVRLNNDEFYRIQP